MIHSTCEPLINSTCGKWKSLFHDANRGGQNGRLILIAFNLKRCQKNKEASTRGGAATVRGDYLTLVRLRTELHEMAPNVVLGISKQIVLG